MPFSLPRGARLLLLKSRALAERVRMRIEELEKQRDALDQTLGELAKLEGEALARVHAHEPEAQRAAG